MWGSSGSGETVTSMSFTYFHAEDIQTKFVVMSHHESQNCEFTCFHIGGVVGDPILLGCEPVLLGWCLPVFQRNITLSPWRWRYYSPLKHWATLTLQYSITSHKTWILRHKTSCTWVRLILSYKWVVAYLSQDWSWLAAAVWFLWALPGLQAIHCCCCFLLWLEVPLCTVPPRTPDAPVSPPPHLIPGHHLDCKHYIFIFLAGFKTCPPCVGHTRVLLRH